MKEKERNKKYKEQKHEKMKNNRSLETVPVCTV